MPCPSATLRSLLGGAAHLEVLVVEDVRGDGAEGDGDVCARGDLREVGDAEGGGHAWFRVEG